MRSVPRITSGSTLNTIATDIQHRQEGHWTPARVYSTYRFFLALMLLAVFLITWPDPLVGQPLPVLFIATLTVFLVYSAIWPLIQPWLNPTGRPTWVLVSALVDTVALTLLIHASGGIGSSLTILLLVTVAAANILLPGRLGLLVASLATMAVMFEQFYYSLSFMETNPFELTGSALLGLSFFVVSVIIQQIALRLARSEALAESQRLAIARLEELNREIVQRMRTGILVFDEDRRILVANRSARELVAGPLEGTALPRQLRDAWREWQANPARVHDPVYLSPQSQALDARFAALNDEESSLTITFLEDRARIVREAQQLKLASLGRMSATIAHEIRNPLSAIRHAAELLAEGSREPEDARLVNIIASHVNRVNAIIDGVLKLSRRPEGPVERRHLGDILAETRQRWLDRGIAEDAIRIDLARDDQDVRFDMQQLEQVLDNLIDNALTHGGEGTVVSLEGGEHPDSHLPWLKVRDNGPGVAEDAIKHLFEPFFTTSRNGTGLGLFVCRELCESNQARLDYESGPDAAFVITFAHPDRAFE